jgi:cardiolipin synthase A/B
MLGHVARLALTGVVLLVATIGFLFLTRGTAVRRVRGVGRDAPPVSPDEPEFPTTVTMLTGAALLPGTRVELALDGDGIFPRLWADLLAAEQIVTVQMYYMGPGQVADRFAEVLVDRARAGVRVVVLFDAFGASALPRAYWRALRAAGVQAVPFRPLRVRNLWVVQNRAHIRGIVVDGRIGWTGGFGIDDKWLGDGRHRGQWRDTAVRLEGPAVHQLQAAIIGAWAEATGELFSGRVAASADQPDAVAGAAVLATAPTLGSTPAERFLALSIAGARRTLYVTNAYFAPDRNFTAMLVQAAVRGVDVRVLVGGASTDVRIARVAGQARYETLLSAGVRIYEYLPSTLHAKTFVVDGCWATVGTMNFDNRSLALNDEVTLAVRDPAFGRCLDAVFHEDLRHAQAIDLATFRRRGALVRAAEWGANLITPLL